MKRYLVTAFAACVASIFLSHAQASPLDQLVAEKLGASACFTRIYDDAHLRANPKQKTTFIAVSLKYEKLQGAAGMALSSGLAIRRRSETEALFSQGSCFWDAKANRDTSNHRMVSAYKKDDGAVCTQSARPDVFESLSAEEGGYFIIDRGKDNNTMMVYLDDGLAMVKRLDRDNAISIDFGKDDQVFMLRRASAKDCEFLEEAVTTPEPGVPDRRR
jgi:hypothetical protein